MYLALCPKEGISVVREWLSLGGTSKMIGTDTPTPRTDSATGIEEQTYIPLENVAAFIAALK